MQYTFLHGGTIYGLVRERDCSN